MCKNNFTKQERTEHMMTKSEIEGIFDYELDLMDIRLSPEDHSKYKGKCSHSAAYHQRHALANWLDVNDEKYQLVGEKAFDGPDMFLDELDLAAKFTELSIKLNAAAMQGYLCAFRQMQADIESGKLKFEGKGFCPHVDMGH